VLIPNACQQAVFGYRSRDWNFDVRVPTPQLEHPQLTQSPEQEQVEQLQGDMVSMVV